MKTRFRHVHEGIATKSIIEIKIELSNHVAAAISTGDIKEHANGGWPDVQGCTVCYLEDDEGNLLARGYAFCMREALVDGVLVKQQFEKKEGRKRSMGRALSKLAKSQKKYTPEKLRELAEMIRRA